MAPVNATLAANRGEEWYAKGFRGFLFQGILDDLRPFPAELELMRLHEANTGVIQRAFSHPDTSAIREGVVLPGDWEMLRAEIRGANNRLVAAGVDTSFLQIRLEPEARYFSSDMCAAVAVNRFRLAGEFCRDTGLRGVAVDTRSSAMMYDFRWDGHPPDVSEDELWMGVRRFARQAMRACIQAYPEGAILLIADHPETAGPLWYALLEGILESVGAADSIPVRLVFTGMADNLQPEHFREYPRAMRRLFQARLSEDAYLRWQRQGGLAFALEPAHYKGDIPTPRLPLAEYRRALYAATIYGCDYTLILAPQGGWWHTPPDLASQFSHLRQGGAAGARYAPPVPRTLDAFAPTLSTLNMTRVGALSVMENEADVLRSTRGAALLFWNGLSTPLSVNTRVGMVSATTLGDENRSYYTPRDGVLTVPAIAEAVLVDGLSLREYALTASMWMDVSPPPTLGVTRNRVQFGLANPLAAPVRGVLSIVGDGRYGLGNASFSLNLAPGEAVRFERTLQGIALPAAHPVFTMHLNIAADAPVTRAFSFPVMPEEVFRWYADAPLAGAPVVLAPEEVPGGSSLFFCDTRGCVTRYDIGADHPVWRVRLRGRYSEGPVLVRDAIAGPGIAIANHQGRVRIFDPVGREKAVLLTGASHTGPLVAVHGEDGDGVNLVVALDAGILALYTGAGRFLHGLEKEMVVHALHAPESWKRGLFVVGASDARHEGDDSSAPAFLLAALEVDGTTRWEHRLSASPASMPILAQSAGGGMRICVGLTTGEIECRNALDGGASLLLEKASDGPVTRLVSLFDAATGASLLVYADEAGIHATPLPTAVDDGAMLAPWSTILPGVTALVALPGDAGVLAGQEDGQLHAFAADGLPLWQEHRASGAITSLTMLEDHASGNAYYCIVSSADHALRVLRVRTDL